MQLLLLILGIPATAAKSLDATAWLWGRAPNREVS